MKVIRGGTVAFQQQSHQQLFMWNCFYYHHFEGADSFHTNKSMIGCSRFWPQLSLSIIRWTPLEGGEFQTHLQVWHGLKKRSAAKRWQARAQCWVGGQQPRDMLNKAGFVYQLLQLRQAHVSLWKTQERYGWTVSLLRFQLFSGCSCSTLILAFHMASWNFYPFPSLNCRAKIKIKKTRSNKTKSSVGKTAFE